MYLSNFPLITTKFLLKIFWGSYIKILLTFLARIIDQCSLLSRQFGYQLGE